jgi:hypothetical protein
MVSGIQFSRYSPGDGKGLRKAGGCRADQQNAYDQGSHPPVHNQESLPPRSSHCCLIHRHWIIFPEERRPALRSPGREVTMKPFGPVATANRLGHKDELVGSRASATAPGYPAMLVLLTSARRLRTKHRQTCYGNFGESDLDRSLAHGSMIGDEPTHTSMCVRKPAVQFNLSRSKPMTLPGSAARTRRDKSSVLPITLCLLIVWR